MNILFEWIFWIFVKWMIFWTNTLVLVCRRQKWLLPNVSKSSEIIQGSIVGPNSVHFRGSFTYTGASGGLRSHFLALFWNFEWFSSFLWIDYFIEYSGLYWMNILDFILNWIIFVARFNEKMNFQNGSAGASPDWPSWPWWPSPPTYLCTYNVLFLVRKPSTSLLKESNTA